MQAGASFGIICRMAWCKSSLWPRLKLQFFETPKPNKRIGWEWNSTPCISCFAKGRISSLVRKMWSTVILRVICWKSRNFTFSVSVRPSKSFFSMRLTNSNTV